MTEPLRILLEDAGRSAAVAADLLVSSVWKGVVLVAFVALLLRCLPRLGAAARSRLWTAVLLVVMLLPMFPGHAGARNVNEQSVVHAGAAWSLLLAGAWAAISGVRLLQLAASALRLRAIARRAVPVSPGEPVRALLSRSARRMELCVSGDVSRPSVAGFLRPRILLPLGMLEELSAPELAHVVVHEMEHLRRGDDWTNLLQKLSLALFPLHPALLWLDRRLCVERELACDDGVLRVTHARKAYAACLARLAEDSMVRRGLSLALSLLGVQAGRSELSRRVQRILRSPGAAMGRAQVAGASAVLLAAVVGGSMLLARSPQLISFGSASEASTPQALAQLGEPSERSVLQRPSNRLPATATLVSAVMPAPKATSRQALEAARANTTQSATKLTRLVASTDRKTAPLRRVGFAPSRQREASPYLVYTEWQSVSTPSHMTFAVAPYARPTVEADAAPSPAVSQKVSPTYAAVPVRGGWLLIQL